MFDKRAEKDAVRFGILDKIQALEDDLMKIHGVSDIEFDIRDYGDLRYVILIPKYKVDTSDLAAYFIARGRQLENILDTCRAHGLYHSGDRIEDYGEHWYIVRRCDKTWPEAKNKT